MKGIGWLVILLGLLGVGYLLARDLGVLRGEQAGQAVVQPLAQARHAAELIQNTEDTVQRGLERAQR